MFNRNLDNFKIDGKTKVLWYYNGTINCGEHNNNKQYTGEQYSNEQYTDKHPRSEH